jgi:hypothetical protein
MQLIDSTFDGHAKLAISSRLKAFFRSLLGFAPQCRNPSRNICSCNLPRRTPPELVNPIRAPFATPPSPWEIPRLARDNSRIPGQRRSRRGRHTRARSPALVKWFVENSLRLPEADFCSLIPVEASSKIQVICFGINPLSALQCLLRRSRYLRSHGSRDRCGNIFLERQGCVARSVKRIRPIWTASRLRVRRAVIRVPEASRRILAVSTYPAPRSAPTWLGAGCLFR